jgi:hypothetical protein
VIDKKGDSWTYGCEHELSDWVTTWGLPEGFQRSPDYTIVNSNGIAAQPNTKVWPIGGEINTPPTESINNQVDCLDQILERHGTKITINHRSNLHCHVRVPGLKEDLKALKQLQRYVHEQLPSVINMIEPIPVGETLAEKKRERRRYVSHHTFLTQHRLKKQLAAESVQEFFENEVPRSKSGAVMWHAQPRACVNLRQLLQTDTIEFRHFPGTVNRQLLKGCLTWCRDFLLAAFTDRAAVDLLSQTLPLPQFPEFDLALEVGYQATASNNGLKRAEIEQNIQLILKGKFHGSEAEERAFAKAEGRA